MLVLIVIIIVVWIVISGITTDNRIEEMSYSIRDLSSKNSGLFSENEKLRIEINSLKARISDYKQQEEVYLKETRKGKAEISQVATISANSDSSISDLIANAIEAVGDTGVITVEEAKGMESELTVVEGMQFDRGYLSPYFVTNTDKMEVEFENAAILICDKKITSMKDILPILEQIAKQGTPLLIIAEDIEGEALATLVVNKMRGTLNVAAVKAPGFGDGRKAMLQDIAVLTGGSMVSDELGVKLEGMKFSDFGVARKIRITKENTTIVGGKGSKKDIEVRVAQIKVEIENSTSEYGKEKRQERLTKLFGDVAIIKIGGASEGKMKAIKNEVQNRIRKAEDE